MSAVPANVRAVILRNKRERISRPTKTVAALRACRSLMVTGFPVMDARREEEKKEEEEEEEGGKKKEGSMREGK